MKLRTVVLTILLSHSSTIYADSVYEKISPPIFSDELAFNNYRVVFLDLMLTTHNYAVSELHSEVDGQLKYKAIKCEQLSQTRYLTRVIEANKKLFKNKGDFESSMDGNKKSEDYIRSIIGKDSCESITKIYTDKYFKPVQTFG